MISNIEAFWVQFVYAACAYRVSSARVFSLFFFGLTMRAATVERACTVSLEGIPGRSWKIHKPHDYVVVDDQMFVRLAAWNLGLLTLVYDQHNRPPANTLTTNNGLTRLIGLRNQQQAAHLSDDDGHAQSSLFEPKLKKCRTPQGEQAQKRKSPRSMTLDVPIYTATLPNGATETTWHQIEVLRPVHPCDNLFVACTAEAMAPILHMMRTEGYEEGVSEAQTMPRGKQRIIPTGIQKKKAQWLVKYTKQDGSGGAKSVSTLDEAIRFKAEPSVSPGDETEHGA